MGMFCFYIGFCIVGLLNVVTGIFVDSAVCTRSEDEVVAAYEDDVRSTTQEVMRIFEEADVDGSGTMTFDELKAHLQKPRVQAYFAALDIDPTDARTIFTLIDVDGSGAVNCEEFVNGTMKLKGVSKSIDVISMMYDSARHGAKFSKLCSYVEDQFTEIRELISPGSSAPRGSVFSDLEGPIRMVSKSTGRTTPGPPGAWKATD